MTEYSKLLILYFLKNKKGSYIFRLDELWINTLTIIQHINTIIQYINTLIQHINTLIQYINNNTEEHIFEIVNQFNSGIDLITHKNEKIKLAELNLIAGKKAKSSTAYEAASQYLEKAKKILTQDKDIWENYHQLIFSLNLELSECKYLSGKFEEAEYMFNLVLKQAKTRLEKAKVYILKINLYTDKGKLQQAIGIGLEAAKLFQISLPQKDINLAINREIRKIQTQTGDKQIKDLYNLPEMTDTNAIAIMNIFMSLAASTYFSNLDLWTLLMLKMKRINLFQNCL